MCVAIHVDQCNIKSSSRTHYSLARAAVFGEPLLHRLASRQVVDLYTILSFGDVHIWTFSGSLSEARHHTTPTPTRGTSNCRRCKERWKQWTDKAVLCLGLRGLNGTTSTSNCLRTIWRWFVSLAFGWFWRSMTHLPHIFLHTTTKEARWCCSCTNLDIAWPCSKCSWNDCRRRGSASVWLSALNGHGNSSHSQHACRRTTSTFSDWFK